MKAPAAKIIAPPAPLANPHGFPNGAFLRDGRWLPGGLADSQVAYVVRDLIHWRRTGASPQQFVEWLASYPASTLATKMLGTEMIQRMAETPEAIDWACLGAWEYTDFASWVRHCGRPLRDHFWDERGQWAPKAVRE